LHNPTRQGTLATPDSTYEWRRKREYVNEFVTLVVMSALLLGLVLPRSDKKTLKKDAELTVETAASGERWSGNRKCPFSTPYRTLARLMANHPKPTRKANIARRIVLILIGRAGVSK
jgi:hypothetical protein